MVGRNKLSHAVLLPLVLVLGLIGGIIVGIRIDNGSRTVQEEKLKMLLGLIESQYVDDVKADSILEKVIPDLMATLDPHSVYIPREDLMATNEELDSSFGGVGIMFQVVNDSVSVVEVVSGSPAEQVGLMPGDIILKADTISLSGTGITSDKVFSTLRGKEGTKVNVNVKRFSSDKPLSFEITRGAIPSHSVDATYMASDNTGYLKVSKFARNTYQEFMQALLDLKMKGAEGFIIDLRGNSGGYMDQAIFMANEFLAGDSPIVATKGRTRENNTSAVADGRGVFQNAGLIVLANEYSASASEIFAGAIQDNDRGLVIGRRTFGKGLVQNQFTLPDSSAVRLTVARYYIPSGRCIQKEYKRGKNGNYELDIMERYTRGEFYSADSVKIDKSKPYKTLHGRTVYGGGGIMPDIFVPEDTTGVTGYYIDANNKGLIQKFALVLANKYRPLLKGEKSLDGLYRILPRDNALLMAFVTYASNNGLPSRWFYINKSRDLILNQLKAFIARDLIGYEAFVRILNEKDPTVKRAMKEMNAGIKVRT